MPNRFNLPSDVDYFCVVGQPITHSLSPQIHRAFADSLGIRLCYEKIEVGPGTFADALREFVALGGRGMNVTVPLKEEAFAAAHTSNPRARRARAANTIIVTETRQTVADNTDGIGLITDLQENNGCVIAGTRVLIVGAGGAVRGALPSLVAEKPQSVSIVNRTVAKAQELATLVDSELPVSACGYDRLPDEPFDIVINASAAGLAGEAPPLPAAVIDQATVCYDMVYHKSGTTPFLEWCRSQGARQLSDGLGMLVEQAAAAFHLWHGRQPLTGPVLETLRRG